MAHEDTYRHLRENGTGMCRLSVTGHESPLTLTRGREYRLLYLRCAIRQTEPKRGESTAYMEGGFPIPRFPRKPLEPATGGLSEPFFPVKKLFSNHRFCGRIGEDMETYHKILWF